MAYVKLHPIKQFDFQINRILTYGEKACCFDEVAAAAKDIQDVPTWNDTWRELGVIAECENRFLHAAYYYRLAEFFMTESPEKELMYQSSISNFRKIISQDSGVTVVRVPYADTTLKTFIFKADNPKGTIIIFGGYDSFIEEFYLAAIDMVEHGYEIIMFEGPGQGESLRNGLTFDPYWENSVTAVLDYFSLNDVCLIGISWGGYLAMRAAAFEKRVSKAVAYDVLYDGFECMVNPIPQPVRSLVRLAFALKAKPLINTFMNAMKRKNLILDWAVTHGQYITGTTSPYDFYTHLKQHTMRGISDKVTCDVLLLAGEKDHYIPQSHFSLLHSELINARSVYGRVFTESEGGAEHCQIGDHALAITQIFDWIKTIDHA